MNGRSVPAALLPLDLRSRQVVREFTVQTVIGLVLLLALSAIRMRSLAEVGQVAVRVFTFYGVIECMRALRARERVGGASLNRWDQAAAYALCATLFDLLSTWPSTAS